MVFLLWSETSVTLDIFLLYVYVVLTVCSVEQTCSAARASPYVCRKFPVMTVPTMVKPFPAFSWEANVSKRGDLTWASSSNFSKTSSWGLWGEQSVTREIPGAPRVVCLCVYVFVYLQFLVCGGPSSSLSRANRAALRERPLMPSPHSFSALIHTHTKHFRPTSLRIH